MTEQELRRRLCAAAEAWLGCRESDGSHRPIIDRYNAIRPLPGGYRMKYTDPWCAAFVSAAGAEAGLSEIVLPECSCERMRALYQAAGRFREADDTVPRPGDLVLYDWQDSGVGDCRGEPDHVGVVLSLTGELMKVAEGNKSDAAGLRTLPLNSRYIRGFCLPDYGKLAGAAEPSPESPPEPAPEDPGGTGPGDRPAGDAAVPLSLALPLLRRGSRGEAVRAAQLLLIGRGFPCGPWGADGDFGDATRGAVLRFQGARRLETDGVVGPETWAALLGGGERG